VSSVVANDHLYPFGDDRLAAGSRNGGVTTAAAPGQGALRARDDVPGHAPEQLGYCCVDALDQEGHVFFDLVDPQEISRI
jgi:hypothetical protein